MGDYDFKPSGSLKLKGVKDKKIKKSKKEKSKKEAVPAKSSPAPEDTPATDKYVVVQTEAEKRFEEIQRQRMAKKIEKNALKSHRERVEDLNKYLDSLSEHHDMPKVGPG